jgi:hypothetical protein
MCVLQFDIPNLRYRYVYKLFNTSLVVKKGNAKGK